MAKASARYQCRECGALQPKWSGQCPDCKSWNSIDEVPVAVRTGSGNWHGTDTAASVIRLCLVDRHRERIVVVLCSNIQPFRN